MIIYIQPLDRYWEPGKIFLKGEDKKTREEFSRFVADEYVNFVKRSIDLQRYRRDWPPLSDAYLKYKEKEGLSLKIWEATKETKNSLRVLDRRSYLEVGYDRRRRHKLTKEPLYEIARKMEYGDFRTKPRPLFRLAYIHFSKNISYYWELYKSR